MPNRPSTVLARLADGTPNDPSDEDWGWSIEIAIPWSALAPPAGFTHPAAEEDTAAEGTAGTPDPIARPVRHGHHGRPHLLALRDVLG